MRSTLGGSLHTFWDVVGATLRAGPKRPEDWAVEVKHGKQIPRTLLQWWKQTQQNTPEGKRPLLVLHPAGAAYADSLAVVHLADLAELHPVRRKGAETETDRVWATPDR